MANDRAPGFYWVLPVIDVDTDATPDEWPNIEQPAYWDGSAWEMLGTEDWAVRYVGGPVVPTQEAFNAGFEACRAQAEGDEHFDPFGAYAGYTKNGN